MGMAYKGICYPDRDSARNAFLNDPPTLINSDGTSWTIVSAVNHGVVTNRIQVNIQKITPTTTDSTNYGFNFLTCTTPTNFKDTPLKDVSVTDITVIVSLIFAVLLGFGHGMTLKGFGN